MRLPSLRAACIAVVVGLLAAFACESARVDDVQSSAGVIFEMTHRVRLSTTAPAAT
jgi:hypothetical protein